MNAKFFDDLHPGEKFVSGGITLTESEIIGFALTYDPQPFHLNAVVAAESIYGGLIANSFQVVSLTFRLFIQLGVFTESSMGSPGIDKLRWFAPARPGDTLHAELEKFAEHLGRELPAGNGWRPQNPAPAAGLHRRRRPSRAVQPGSTAVYTPRRWPWRTRFNRG